MRSRFLRVARFERVFRVPIRHLAGDEPPVNTYGAAGPLRLPADLRPLVRDTVTSFVRQIRVEPAPATVDAQAVTGTLAGRGPARSWVWIRGCAAARATGAFSYAQVRRAYGVDRLGAGAGASVAILGLQEAPSARDIADNARCFGYPRLRSITLLTDGQSFPIGPGDDFEPQEDMALPRGMAPGASLTFTQAVSGSASPESGATRRPAMPAPAATAPSAATSARFTVSRGPDHRPLSHLWVAPG